MSAAAGRICFVACVESGQLEAQTVRLAESIRRFGGSFADSEILAVTARFGPPLASDVGSPAAAAGGTATLLALCMSRTGTATSAATNAIATGHSRRSRRSLMIAWTMLIALKG